MSERFTGEAVYKETRIDESKAKMAFEEAEREKIQLWNEILAVRQTASDPDHARKIIEEQYAAKMDALMAKEKKALEDYLKAIHVVAVVGEAVSRQTLEE